MQTPGWHNTSPCQYTLLTTGTITLTGAVCFVGFLNLSATAQTNTVQASDGTQVISPAIALGASAVYLAPLGGIAPKTSTITVTASAGLTTGVLVLWQPISVGPGVSIYG